MKSKKQGFIPVVCATFFVLGAVAAKSEPVKIYSNFSAPYGDATLSVKPLIKTTPPIAKGRPGRGGGS